MKRFIWLTAVWIKKILLAPKNMKVPFFKSLYYNIFGGFTSDQVALYNLNKNNKKEYLSEFDWYKSRKINGKHAKLLNNKVKFTEFIKKYAKTPEIYFIKEDRIYKDTNGNKIDINDAMQILKKNKSTFLKPISKGKGTGIKKIDFKNKTFYLNYNEVNENIIKKYLEFHNNYFVSKAIKQAGYLDNIFDKTANTIRIVTAREDDEVKVLFAVQRFGDLNSIPVDNGSVGGIVANIDLKNGKLSEARSIKNKNIYYVHPFSKNNIQGIKIPDFNKIKNHVIELMEKMPQIKFIAWDLLITNKDIYIIEANSSSGINIIQVFGGQRNKALGNFYKANGIIK